MIDPSNILRGKILIVDDQEPNVRLLDRMLRGAGYVAVSSTMDSREVCTLHREHRYDLILLDLQMPVMDGFQVMEGLKEIEAGGYLPVLAVTAHPGHKLRALQGGAKDFVSKPFDLSEVLMRVHNMLEVRLLHEAARDHGRTLETLARFDSLTDLPNRRHYHESLERALTLAGRETHFVSVLFIDLDRFKNVNDTLGHALGDELLRKVGARMTQCLRASDTLGRLGGDEFALVLTNASDPHAAGTVANTLVGELRRPFNLDGHEVRVTASIGIAMFPADAPDAATLMKYADTAMYEAKGAGRDTFRFYTAEMNARSRKKLDLENALRRALDHNEFVLHFQPTMQIDTGRWTGVEALLRWDRPGHGLILAENFISALEETGLIVPVGAWVIDAACKQIADWERSGVGSIAVAVNVSGSQFLLADKTQSHRPPMPVGAASFEGLDFARAAAAALARHRVSPGLLEVELTESTLMSDVDQTVGILRKLKSQGIRISIDDFGTGYSSLAYLRRFPIDTLKIDQSFIRNVTGNADDAAIALAIIGMAHSLKLRVIAEGVETPEQLEFLRAHGCDQAQGFLLARPMPADELANLFRAGTLACIAQPEFQARSV
ncbi:MAG: putative bifunctional diguanylate cyclase/phosphodiesterase [Panacagrimonas sp.]